tara:strand:- start:2949 stop:3233 length:285 start_codon:yes stop_codon:yes gene_type:complete
MENKMTININKTLRDSDLYAKMGQFDAVGIAEGWLQSDSQEQVLVAWQILVDTGMAWTLQGFFGRAASDLLEQGLIQEGDKSAYTKSRFEKGVE